MKTILLSFILNSGVNYCNSQNLLPCNTADSLYNLNKYERINFDGIFEKFYEDTDKIAHHQMDSINNLLRKEGLKNIKECMVSIDENNYQVYFFKYRNRRKRDLFLAEFEQHLLKYQDYWVLEFFLKPGIFVIEKRRKEIVIFRSSNPNILLQFKNCFDGQQSFFINNSILH